jgi:hypothetical protein
LRLCILLHVLLQAGGAQEVADALVNHLFDHRHSRRLLLDCGQQRGAGRGRQLAKRGWHHW